MASIDYMQIALQEAQKAFDAGEVPVGAVLVSDAGEILAQTHNLCETENDPTAHAEVLAIRTAADKLKSPRLPNCDLYVTLEPCPMCATAISFARIRRVYFGGYDPKGGGVEHGPKIFEQNTCHHKPEIYGGIEESACAEILKRFFQERR
ncbi:MAG: nucleoside deaminase [Alphaproteobacteria bacterium]